MSEEVFREVLSLPDNGPPGQSGLSYYVRRDDLLMVFVHTLWSGAGGEGHIETEWLEATLKDHKDARHKLVLGHHPVFPINGFSGTYQREIGHEYTKRFWDILVDGRVFAYLCSHILAFDVQVHRGVLQICSAGAGTAHRMPEGVEYLHCVQAALDEQGLRCQVIDTNGIVRERLEWPLPETNSLHWQEIPFGETDALFSDHLDTGHIIELRLRGRTASDDVAPAQTIFSAFTADAMATIWLGFRGPEQTLTLILGRDRAAALHIGSDQTCLPGMTSIFTSFFARTWDQEACFIATMTTAAGLHLVPQQRKGSTVWHGLLAGVLAMDKVAHGTVHLEGRH
ncbi:hypothetical protein FHS21_006198 [Phyllobacterium trifolii]|uniref:Uncharacterized protein n=1 Tax=Phyllobacterium trifolii TaxID=300193 RepID=A0A839UIZ3_9HYPH|nr:hypothetical protein [Phyllobacterium trifolii]MBB3149744.1 hypothetical protein [Phyllobacterium trifolii]